MQRTQQRSGVEQPVSHAIVVFPAFDAAASKAIEDIRRSYDPLAWRIAAHIEIMAPTRRPTALLRQHITSLTAHQSAFSITLRRAVAVLTPAPNVAEVWLLPEWGSTELLAMHEHLRQDTGEHRLLEPRDYPHLTIASHPDVARCNALATEINSNGLNVSCLVTDVALVALRQHWVDRIASFSLVAPTQPHELHDPDDFTPVCAPCRKLEPVADSARFALQCAL